MLILPNKLVIASALAPHNALRLIGLTQNATQPNRIAPVLGKNVIPGLTHGIRFSAGLA